MLYYILFWQSKCVTINISHICGKMFILEFSFVCLILSTLRTSVLSLFYFWRFMWAQTYYISKSWSTLRMGWLMIPTYKHEKTLNYKTNSTERIFPQNVTIEVICKQIVEWFVVLNATFNNFQLSNVDQIVRKFVMNQILLYFHQTDSCLKYIIW